MIGWDAGRARCRDHVDLFDAAATGSRRAVEKAKRICAWCPVAEVCAAESLAYREPDGVWAGRTPKQRMVDAVLLGVPRETYPSVFEVIDPRVALADALDDAVANDLPTSPVFEAAGVPNNETRRWRIKFDGRLSGSELPSNSSKMRVS